MRLALFLLALPLYCQTYPSTFEAWGVSAYASTTPKPAGWGAVAIKASNAGPIYSYTETNYVPVIQNKKIIIQTSVQSGAAPFLRKIGSASLYALGTAGVATTGTVSGLAASGGGVLIIPVGKSKWDAVVGVQFMHTVIDTTTLVRVGIGHHQ